MAIATDYVVNGRCVCVTLIDTYVQVCGWVCVYNVCIVLFKSPTDKDRFIVQCM